MLNRIVISLLLLLSFYLSIQSPLFGDEAIYSIAIKDNIELGLQTTATYYGETMNWKPSLMFNVYAIIASPFYKLIPEEILFRAISLLFVVASLFILFYFFKNEFNNDKKAYWGIILILITPCFFVYSTKIFTDILMFLFVCGALYLTQKINENKWNKILLMLCFVGVGLTKSMIFVLLIIVMCLLYYFTKNKKINYEIIGIGIITIIFLMLHTQLLGIQSLNQLDINRLTKISLDNLGNSLMKIVAYMGLMIIALIKPKKELLPLYLFLLCCIIYLILYQILLPWYLFPILPLFVLFIVDLKKEIIIFLIFNLFLITILNTLLAYGNYNYLEIMDEDFSKTIYIGRLGDMVANMMYDYDSVVVTPQNSFKKNFEFDKLNNWYGWPEKMTRENLLGLIYDYENPDLWPKYVEELTPEEKYLTPIARTHKNWEGDFEKIIIEKQYYIIIEKEILEEYELVKIIDEEKNNEEPLYILIKKVIG